LSLVVQSVINALSLGGIYALVTLGLAILFGVMRLINFAYGVLIAIGGYTLYLTTGAPWVAQAAIVILVTAIASVLMERVAFRPLKSDDAVTLLVTSFAISWLIQSVLFVTVGSRPVGIPLPDFLSQSISLGGVNIPSVDIATIIAALVSIAVVTFLLQRTVFGLRLRAASEDKTMTQLLGIRPNMLTTSAFALSGALAGIASLFYLARGAVVEPTAGQSITLIAFVAIVIGGMGSLVGAALGGLIIGVVEGVLSAVLPSGAAAFSDAIVFGVVIIVLLVRPTGLIAVRGNVERV